jgi:hypothetical protein
VFTDRSCGRGEQNHEMVAVGYGTDPKGINYWVIGRIKYTIHQSIIENIINQIYQSVMEIYFHHHFILIGILYELFL